MARLIAIYACRSSLLDLALTGVVAQHVEDIVSAGVARIVSREYNEAGELVSFEYTALGEAAMGKVKETIANVVTAQLYRLQRAAADVEIPETWTTVPGCSSPTLVPVPNGSDEYEIVRGRLQRGRFKRVIESIDRVQVSLVQVDRLLMPTCGCFQWSLEQHALNVRAELRALAKVWASSQGSGS